MTDKQKVDLTELQRVLNIYLKFSKHYSIVDLQANKNNITVTWSAPKDIWYQFEQITFPIKDLKLRIEHYKKKVLTSFKNRNKLKHVK